MHPEYLRLQKEDNPLFNSYLVRAIERNHDLLAYEVYMYKLSYPMLNALFTLYEKGRNLYRIYDWSTINKDIAMNFFTYVKNGHHPNEFTFNVKAKLPYQLYVRHGKPENLFLELETMLRATDLLNTNIIEYWKICKDLDIDLNEMLEFVNPTDLSDDVIEFKVYAGIKKAYGTVHKIENSYSHYKYSIHQDSVNSHYRHMYFPLQNQRAYSRNLDGMYSKRLWCKAHQAQLNATLRSTKLVEIMEICDVNKIDLDWDLVYQWIQCNNPYTCRGSVLMYIENQKDYDMYLNMGLTQEELDYIFTNYYTSRPEKLYAFEYMNGRN